MKLGDEITSSKMNFKLAKQRFLKGDLRLKMGW